MEHMYLPFCEGPSGLALKMRTAGEPQARGILCRNAQLRPFRQPKIPEGAVHRRPPWTTSQSRHQHICVNERIAHAYPLQSRSHDETRSGDQKKSAMPSTTNTGPPTKAYWHTRSKHHSTSKYQHAFMSSPFPQMLLPAGCGCLCVRALPRKAWQSRYRGRFEPPTCGSRNKFKKMISAGVGW